MPHDSPRTSVICCQESQWNPNGVTPMGTPISPNAGGVGFVILSLFLTFCSNLWSIQWTNGASVLLKFKIILHTKQTYSFLVFYFTYFTRVNGLHQLQHKVQDWCEYGCQIMLTLNWCEQTIKNSFCHSFSRCTQGVMHLKTMSGHCREHALHISKNNIVTMHSARRASVSPRVRVEWHHSPSRPHGKI